MKTQHNQKKIKDMSENKQGKRILNNRSQKSIKRERKRNIVQKYE